MGIFSTAILTLILPVAAKAGIGMVVALRVLMGFAEGVTIPCMHGIWSKWAPPLERTRMAGITVAGQYMGAVIAMSTCGVLAQNYGWESVSSAITFETSFFQLSGFRCFMFTALSDVFGMFSGHGSSAKVPRKNRA